MAKTNDYTAMFKNMTAAMPVDMSAFQDAFKNSAGYGEKFSKLTIDAAEKSTAISVKWIHDTLAKLGDVAKAKDEPTDYSKALGDFASAQAEFAAEHLSAFADVAKKLQADTVELMMAAGKSAGEETAAAVKKAAVDVTSAVKKTAA